MVKDKFNFESKIKCKIKFLNLNKILQTKLQQFVKEHPCKISNNVLFIKFKGVGNTFCEQLITEYLEYLNSEDLFKSDFGIYDKIFWKTNKIKFSIENEFDNDSDNENEYEYEFARKGDKSKIPSESISRTDSMSDFGNFNCINNDDRSYRAHEYYLIKAQKKDLFKSKRYYYQQDKHLERMNILTNIDVIEIINEYSGTINNTKKFTYKDLPDTRNPRRLNKDTLIRINSYLDTDIHIMNNVRKKDVIWLIIVLFFIFIIVKLI
jgi:hypothetical protein